jgi:hypothetical protein
MNDIKRKASKRSKASTKTFKLATTVAALGMSLGANVDAIFAQAQIDQDVVPAIEIDQFKFLQYKMEGPFVDINKGERRYATIFNPTSETVIVQMKWFNEKSDLIDFSDELKLEPKTVIKFDTDYDARPVVFVQTNRPIISPESFQVSGYVHDEEGNFIAFIGSRPNVTQFKVEDVTEQ